MIKEAFEQGYMLGMTKNALDFSDIGLSGALLLGGIPVIGGMATGYLHGALAKKNYRDETKQLLSSREADIKKERNEKLRREVQKLLKQKNLTLKDIGYSEL